MVLTKPLKGTRLTIQHCEGDSENGSWKDALSSIDANRRDNHRANMLVLLRYLAAGNKLHSPKRFRKEGKLPNGKYFYAIKAGRVRAYGWFSSKHSRVFFISHYAFKSGESLDQSDSNIVCANWRKIEEN